MSEVDDSLEKYFEAAWRAITSAANADIAREYANRIAKKMGNEESPGSSVA